MVPADGTVVTQGVITVRGTAPDGAEIVWDVPFARDVHVIAHGGAWWLDVTLHEGENELTFRIGDDDATAATVRVTYRPELTAARTPAATAPEPTTEPTPAPTPTPEPTEVPPLAVTKVKLTSPVRHGYVASVTVRTAAGARCEVEVDYNSGPSTAAGLYPKTADSGGRVSWSWKVGTRTYPGTYPIYVTCSKGDRNGDLTLYFRVT